MRSFKLPDTVLQRIARWTPDGQGVVYGSVFGGVANLWRQPLDGSPPTQLTYFDKETIDNFDWDGEGKTNRPHALYSTERRRVDS